MGKDTKKFKRCIGNFREKYFRKEREPNHELISKMMGSDPSPHYVRGASFDEYLTSRLWTVCDNTENWFNATVGIVGIYLHRGEHKRKFRAYQRT